MCGIAGLLSFRRTATPGVDELHAMLSRLHHRGPDGTGFHVDGPVGLAHARLSIIDPQGGAQPIFNEDRSVCVIFNGEIFNYIELRARLREQGHRFATDSDTEVLVHLYEQHGDDFVEHLNGQFAIALWDSRRQRLLLARDRVGIRPLFYTWNDGRLAFASEVKALFALPEVPRRLDPLGLASVFNCWAVLPPRTVFEGVMALPSGHLMVIDATGSQVQRWWDWSYPAASDLTRASEDDCAEALRELLIDAVRLQLRADVPVGAYLSGGLDSSIITSIIHHHADTPLRTFSLTFEDAEFDESVHQRELATWLGTTHSAIHCTRADIAAGFARLVWHAESPLVRTAPVPMMLLADSVRAAGFKVVLTGEGADEVFGGYDLFKEAHIRRFIAREPGSKWRPRILDKLYPYLAHSPVGARALSQRFFTAGLDQVDQPWFAHATRLSTTQRVQSYFSPDWRAPMQGWDAQAAISHLMPEGAPQWEPMSRDQYVEAQTLMSGYLLSSQGDRPAMAASIESRVPFLDHRVIEFANQLPARFKLRGLNEKVLLRKAMRTELPPSIGRRTKQPYRAPESACLFQDGKALPWVAELLSPQSLTDAGMFDPVAVGKLTHKCAAGRAIGFGDNMAMVGVLSTMLLHDQFIRGNAFTAP